MGAQYPAAKGDGTYLSLDLRPGEGAPRGPTLRCGRGLGNPSCWRFTYQSLVLSTSQGRSQLMSKGAISANVAGSNEIRLTVRPKSDGHGLAVLPIAPIV